METMETVDRWWDIITTVLPWFFGIVAALLVASKLVGFVLGVLDHRRLLHQKTVLLELKPPASNDKTPYSTYKLFTLLHGLVAAQHAQDKLLKRKVTILVRNRWHTPGRYQIPSSRIGRRRSRF